MTTWLQALTEIPPWQSAMLKMTALLAAAWFVHFALVRANPRWRVLLWRGVLVGLLFLPLAEWIGPKLEVPIAQRPPVVESHPLPAAPAKVLPVAPLPAFPQDPLPVQSLPKTEPVAPTFSIRDWIAAHPYQIASTTWLCVVCVLSVLWLVRATKLKRFLQATDPAPPPLRELLEKVQHDLGCRKKVALRLTPENISPFLAGTRRPTIVIPERMTEAPNARDLPSVLAHELAHVKSGDVFWTHALRAASILLWFHPLVWRMKSAHAAACEQVCDTVAATYLGDTTAYSQTLARAALDLLVDSPAVSGLPMIRTAEITRRLRKLKRGIRWGALSREALISVLSVSCCLISLIGSVKLVTAEIAADEVTQTNGTNATNPKDSHKTDHHASIVHTSIVPRLQFRLVAEGAASATAEVFPLRNPNEHDGESLPLEPEILLTETDIQSVSVQPSHATDTYLIQGSFTEEAKIRFAVVTGNNINRKLAMLFDGEIVTAPVIRDRITGGQFVIEGLFSKVEAEEIAEAIRAANPDTDWDSDEESDDHEPLGKLQTGTKLPPTTPLEVADATEELSDSSETEKVRGLKEMISRKILEVELEEARVSGRYSQNSRQVRAIRAEKEKLLDLLEKQADVDVRKSVEGKESIEPGIKSNRVELITRRLLELELEEAQLSARYSSDSPQMRKVRAEKEKLSQLLEPRFESQPIDENDLDTVKRLFREFPAIVKIRNASGQTPLILAARNGHKEIVEFLLEQGAEVNAKDNDGKNAWYHAAFNNRMDIANLLVRHGSTWQADDRRLIRALSF